MSPSSSDDTISSARSKLMARVRGKDTTPEMAVRRAAHALGYRFRLHRRDLPGSPDLVFPRLRKIIFVHGCFWHRHPGCRRSTIPKTRSAFWENKFAQNVSRDRRNVMELQLGGWNCEVIWECETRDADRLRCLLERLLSD